MTVSNARAVPGDSSAREGERREAASKRKRPLVAVRGPAGPEPLIEAVTL